METFHFEHFQDSISTLNLAVFHSIPSGDELSERFFSLTNQDGHGVRDGVRDEHADQSQFALVDCSRIVSRKHLLTACHQAMLSASNSMSNSNPDSSHQPRGGMRTRQLNSEILWKLSPSSNISESLKSFGLSSQTSSVVVISIGAPPSTQDSSTKLLSRMRSLIKDGILIEQGSSVLDLSDADRASKGLKPVDWDEIDRIYKVAISKERDTLGDEERKRIDRLVTSLVAMKSVNI